MLKANDKDKILKTVREKKLHYVQIKIRKKKTMQDLNQYNTSLKKLKEEKNPNILIFLVYKKYPLKGTK